MRSTLPRRPASPSGGQMVAAGCIVFVFNILFWAAIIGGAAVALKWALGR